MSEQIASMFAKMGFDIDSTAVDKIEKTIKDVRASSALLARNLRAMNTQLNVSSKYLNKIAKADGTGASIKTLGNNYTALGNHVHTAREKTAKFGRTLALVDPRIDKSAGKIELLTTKYAELTKKISETNAAISRTKVVSARQPSMSGVGMGRGGRGYSQQGLLQGRDQGYFNNAYGAAGGFLRSFLPAGGLLAGRAISAGAAVAEVKKRGQAQQAMQQALMFSSKGMEDFNDSLKFVKDEALRLGMSSQDLGRALGQINMSSSLSKDSKKKLITDTSEVVATLKLSKVDQGLIWYAVNQMFSLGKMQGEEIRQLTERGISKTLLYDAIKQTYGVKSQEEAMKMQEAGKLDPNKVLPVLFANMNKMGHESGAYDAAMKASITKQNIFVERLNQGSAQLMEAGLDEFLGLIFDGLSKALPYLISFTKGLMGAGKGIVNLVKTIKNWAMENPVALGTISALTLGVALFTGKIIAGTGALGVFANTFIRILPIITAVLKRIPIILFFTTLMYVFKAYQEYLSGSNNWLTLLSKLLAGAALDVNLLITRFNLLMSLISSGRLKDAVKMLWSGLDSGDTPSIKENTSSIFGALTPYEVIKRIIMKGVNPLMGDINSKENQPKGIPYANSNFTPPRLLGKFTGEVTVNLDVSNMGQKVGKQQIQVPLRLDTGGMGYLGGGQ